MELEWWELYCGGWVPQVGEGVELESLTKSVIW